VKKDKQLDERKLCSFFAKPQKQSCLPYFSSTTNISAYAIFTGEPPNDDALSYQKDTFDTNLTYSYINLIAVNMDEESLIAAKSNPFTLAMLAARYVFLGKDNPELRSEYKKQLFQYIKESGIPLGKMIKLFIFVRDFVHLPEPLELDFLNLQKSLNFSTEYIMQFSKGTKQMAIEIFERTH
jgi:hypothetical protein